jgi:hypothetical protein
VCLHYATGLRKQHVAQDGGHPLLQWIGGYFATGCEHHRSIARVCRATLRPTDSGHEILRGWKAFTLDDEPYWNNYFGTDGPAANVTPLVTAMLPPESPEPEIVGWAVSRPDGGRGVGIVFPHFYRNWQIAELRTLIMNGIFWSARVAIPTAGVQTVLPELTRFAPDSVEPKTRKPR